jgi:hypothetical protein
VRAPLFAIAALIAGTLAACGTTSSSSSSSSVKGSDETNVANVIANLASYGQSKSTSKICNQLFSAELAKQIAASAAADHGSCETALGNQLNNVDDFTTSVKSVTVNGNTAQAVVQSRVNGSQKASTIDFVKAPDGTWRISSMQ